jgi:two-component system, response regulator PdtaR
MPAESIKVVIADDDLPFTFLARAYLESSGFEVTDVVADGRRAVEACRRSRPDVVLLDIVMPELDGIAAADQVLRDLEETTVIVLSSMTDEELIDRAGQLGITHYHVKPISRDQLRACILTAVAADRRCKEAERRLKERKVVERAKGLIMDSRGLTEADAYRFLRTESQNRRMSIHNLAAAVLMAEDLLTKVG